MNKIFRCIGILSLFIGSFVYSEKVELTSKQTDPLLTKIEEEKENYKVDSTESIITESTIIPGKNGKEVDVDKSYKKMSEVGYFDDNLFVYKEIKINNSLEENTDKYIISGSNIKEVSLLFDINQSDKLLNILENNNIKASFYMSSNYIEKDYDKVIDIIKKGHTILITDTSSIEWFNVITSYNYCYASSLNDDLLKSCSDNNFYTIYVEPINNTPFINVKRNLHNGSIISFSNLSILEDQLQTIITYIQSKGYEIKNINDILKE